jgi:hypothetical protein
MADETLVPHIDSMILLTFRVLKAMLIERSQHLGAGHYQRSRDRIDYAKLMVNENYSNKKIIAISGAGPSAVTRWISNIRTILVFS